MATQTTVINETTPGKSWLVYWDLRGTPAESGRNALTSDATYFSSCTPEAADLPKMIRRMCCRLFPWLPINIAIEVDALKEICENCLIRQLEMENVLGHLERDYLYGACTLKETAFNYIVKERYYKLLL